MKNIRYRTCLVTAAMVIYGDAALAQERKLDLGKYEYDTNCAICHGMNGKGNGIMTEFLRIAPPDLTQLAKKNHGVLPTSRLFNIIEGNSVPIHGTRDMPVWGKEFSAEEAGYYKDARSNYESQALVRARILTLLEYIDRIQERKSEQ